MTRSEKQIRKTDHQRLSWSYYNCIGSYQDPGPDILIKTNFSNKIIPIEGEAGEGRRRIFLYRDVGRPVWVWDSSRTPYLPNSKYFPTGIYFWKTNNSWTVPWACGHLCALCVMATLVHLTHSGLRIVTEELARQTFILLKSLLINHKYIIISRKLIIFHSLIKFCVLKTF